MAKKNVLFERDNFIGQLINRAGIAEVDISVDSKNSTDTFVASAADSLLHSCCADRLCQK